MVSPPSETRRTALLLVLIALIVFTAWLVLLPPGRLPNRQFGQGPVAPSQPVLDLAAAASAVNEGLAHLENESLERSNAIFAELAEKLPDDPLPARNLAVSLILSVKDPALAKSADERSALSERTEAAIRRVLALEPQSDVGPILQSQFLLQAGRTADAVAAAKQATELNPDSVANWYELSLAAQFETDPESQTMRREALARAYALAPANLAVLLDHLKAQVEHRDPGVTETLQRAETLYGQLAEGIRQRTRVDPRQFLTSAIEAAGREDWPAVAQGITVLRNVTVPDDAAKGDRRRVERNPLEFVLRSFGPKYQVEINQLASAVESGIEVSFSFETISAPADLSAATDLLVADFNLDRKSDLAVKLPDRTVILGSGTDGAWTVIAEIPDTAGTARILAADLDTDGNDALRKDRPVGEHCHTADLDLLTYGTDGVRLFEARLDALGGALVYEARDSGDALRGLKQVRLVKAADLNSDGDLDLLVLAEDGLSLWTNNGNLTFARMAVQLDPGAGIPVDLAAVDWDRDIDMDVLVALQSGAVGLLENLRLGTFRWSPWDPGIPSEEQPATASSEPRIEIADSDNDGNWELLMTLAGDLRRTPTSFIEPGKVQLGTPESFAGGDGGIHIWDYDNDGNIDLLCGGSELKILRGIPTRTFEDTTAAVLKEGRPAPARRVAVGDLDADGDEDLTVLTDDGVRIAWNQGGNANRWIDVGLLAEQAVRGQTTESGRVNHFGIGSVVELRSGVHYRQRLVNGQTTHFGLGPEGTADAVRVLWPNGIPENVVHPDPNSLICERQSLKGSCPYLYTWNGERFAFHTDLLWASPIGLHDPQGNLVPSREWEFLKIPGESLVAKDGEYVLGITEELWEFAYFDQVELIAVDHPADVEIFTNDKVGPPAIAAYGIHTARKLRRPVGAVNHQGRNLLPLLRQNDERYARVHDRKLMQGYTEDCYVELDLGLKKRPKSLKLFLTGWIMPTDTSINAALQENPDLAGPRPPWISVPNASGKFMEAVPFMGFPGGKTKTIVVDVSDIFPADDFRLRIHTSQEIYWDRIAFTVDEPAVSCETQTLKLLGADLHERGVSARIEHPRNGPEGYDYEQVQASPAWPALSGKVTRFGDVTSLLRHADDRSVVMVTGDEMTVRFQVPAAPLPEGWKRDFLLHNVGWDKDGDLQTVYGRTVEPYPFRAMKRYPYWPEQSAPDDEEFNESLRTFQTRDIPQRGFVRSFRAGR